MDIERKENNLKLISTFEDLVKGGNTVIISELDLLKLFLTTNNLMLAAFYALVVHFDSTLLVRSTALCVSALFVFVASTLFLLRAIWMVHKSNACILFLITIISKAKIELLANRLENINEIRNKSDELSILLEKTDNEIQVAYWFFFISIAFAVLILVVLVSNKLHLTS